MQYLGVTTAFADSKSEYAAVIYFSSEDSAKWLVYNAYSSLARIDNKLDKLIHPTIQAIDGTISSSDRYYLDLKFQSRKHDIDDVFNKSTTWFNAFNDEEITVEINDDGYGRHFLFNLPKMNIVDLGIVADDLLSVEDANTAIAHITSARHKLNSILPLGENEAAMTKFNTNKTFNLTNKNKFSVVSQKDSQAILISLDNIKHHLMGDLDIMMKLANDAATGKHTQQEIQELDAQFQGLTGELSRILAAGCRFGNIKTFNGNSLQFQTDGNNRIYLFTKLNLDVFNLKNDSIAHRSLAQASLEHLFFARTWVRDWMITGTASAEVIKNKNVLNELAFLNLTDKERVILQKS